MSLKKIVSPCAMIVHPDGTSDGYFPSANTDVAAGIQLAAAQAASVSGEIVNSFRSATIPADGHIGKDGVVVYVPRGVTITCNPSGDYAISDGGASGIYVVSGAGKFTSATAQFPVVFTAGTGYIDFDEISCSGVSGTSGVPVYIAGTGNLTLRGRIVTTSDYTAIWMDGSSGGTAGTLTADVGTIQTANDSAVEITNATTATAVIRAQTLKSTDAASEPVVQLAATGSGVSVRIDAGIIQSSNGHGIFQSDTGGSPNIQIQCPKIVGNVQAGSLTLIGGGVIDSSALAAATLTLSGSNVTLIGDWQLVTKSSETYSINASSAKTLTVIGSLTMNKAVHPNVTITYSSSLANPLTVYASGTAYSLTNSSAALDFGTTDPSLTLNKPGTYLILGRVNLKYNVATFAASRTVTLKLRRTNNTAADLTNGSIALATDIITTKTFTFASVALSTVVYTTLNSDDVITIFGDVSAAPTAGSLDAVEASIQAIRIG